MSSSFKRCVTTIPIPFSSDFRSRPVQCLAVCWILLASNLYYWCRSKSQIYYIKLMSSYTFGETIVHQNVPSVAKLTLVKRTILMLVSFKRHVKFLCWDLCFHLISSSASNLNQAADLNQFWLAAKYELIDSAPTVHILLIFLGTFAFLTGFSVCFYFLHFGVLELKTECLIWFVFT